MKYFQKEKMRKKPLLIFLAVLVVALSAAYGTQAFMAAETGGENNIFHPGVADIEVSEPNGSSYAIDGNSYAVDGNSTIAKKVAITNVEHDGHAIPVYVRVKLVPVLRDANGDGTGEPVNVTYPLANPGSWTELQSDGYYYYKGILQPGVTTPDLIDQATVDSKAIASGALSGGKKLEIQVLADSIQADESAVRDAWGMTYSSSVWTPAA